MEIYCLFFVWHIFNLFKLKPLPITEEVLLVVFYQLYHYYFGVGSNYNNRAHDKRCTIIIVLIYQMNYITITITMSNTNLYFFLSKPKL